MDPIPLCVPDLSGNEATYVADCIETNFVSSVGPYVSEFESRLALAAGSQFAVAMSSGTTALEIALRMVGVAPNELVAMPSFTFIATANAVSHIGALPWLFDVCLDSWTLNPAQVRLALEDTCMQTKAGLVHRKTGKRVAAVVPVFAAGHPADLESFVTIRDELGVPVVLDAAAGVGATYQGKPFGQIDLLASHSFNGNKTITCGGGGAITTNDENFAARGRHLSTTARVNSDYLHDEIGFNYRLTNLNAAVGCAQLERLEAFLARKRSAHVAYSRLATNFGHFGFPEADWGTSSHWMSGIVLSRDSSFSVGELVQRLNAQGIGARPFWRPMHEQPPYSRSLSADLNVTNEVWQRIITLPCSSGLTDFELARTVEVLEVELSKA